LIDELGDRKEALEMASKLVGEELTIEEYVEKGFKLPMIFRFFRP